MTRRKELLLSRIPKTDVVAASASTGLPPTASSSSTAASNESPCFIQSVQVPDNIGSRKFELKRGSDMHISVPKTTTDVRASPVPSSDYMYEKRDLKSTPSIPSTKFPSATAIEAKIKTLASYLKSVSASIRRRGMAFDRSRLVQAYNRRSVPTPAAIRTKLSVIMSRHSSGEHQTTFSWDDIDEEWLNFEDLDETMTVSTLRRRSYPSEHFTEAKIRQICIACDVLDSHVEQVVQIIKLSFGSAELDLIALEEFMPGNVVVFIGMLIFESIDLKEEFIDHSVMASFLKYIQARYDENMPFHNATHAADVMHTLFMMFWTTNLGDKISLHNQIGALLAAVMHDIEHVGLTNDYLIHTNHPIAQQYATKAPMESKHIDLALRALVDPKFDILAKMSPIQQEQVLEVVQESIAATALIYQPELLSEIHNTTTEEWEILEDDEVLSQSLQVRVLRIALHVSDIGQTMKPFPTHHKWVLRLNDEHFKQGDLDVSGQQHVSPWFCFREMWTYEKFLGVQVCFLKKMALPAVMALDSIPWLGVKELVRGIEENIAEWEGQGAAQ